MNRFNLLNITNSFVTDPNGVYVTMLNLLSPRAHLFKVRSEVVCIGCISQLAFALEAHQTMITVTEQSDSIKAVSVQYLTPLQYLLAGFVDHLLLASNNRRPPAGGSQTAHNQGL